ESRVRARRWSGRRRYFGTIRPCRKCRRAADPPSRLVRLAGALLGTASASSGNMSRGSLSLLVGVCVLSAALDLAAQDSPALPSRPVGTGLVYGMPDDTDWTGRLAE